MQQVGINAEWRLAALVLGDRDLVLLGEIQQFRAAGQIPFAPGGDDLDVGVQRIGGQLEPDLIVALAGGAMADGIGAGFGGIIMGYWSDKRGMGDIHTKTVAEYKALSAAGRLKYRLYRHPIVLFGLGPGYIFVLQNRLPLGLMASAQYWISAMGTSTRGKVKRNQYHFRIRWPSFTKYHVSP